ncbi:unnamed protein product [Cuscuta europaea]|uniref:Uncharacterized protein n=1 Tax=Cuscuta europaea TaxID=41803 RepID=A0A9P1EIR5_CUSEU|nr:unnamed protein product [Cuscuta europaea]
MPTRYTLDVDLKDAISIDCLQSRDKRVTPTKEVKSHLEEHFKSLKNRCGSFPNSVLKPSNYCAYKHQRSRNRIWDWQQLQLGWCFGRMQISQICLYFFGLHYSHVHVIVLKGP